MFGVFFLCQSIEFFYDHVNEAHWVPWAEKRLDLAQDLVLNMQPAFHKHSNTFHKYKNEALFYCCHMVGESVPEQEEKGVTRYLFFFFWDSDNWISLDGRFPDNNQHSCSGSVWHLLLVANLRSKLWRQPQLTFQGRKRL